MIAGVVLKDLDVHEDDRGMLYEILSENHPNWNPDEPMVHAYISTCDRHVAKATHCHLLQADRFCVVHGRSKVLLLDLRGPLADLPQGVGKWVYGKCDFLNWLERNGDDASETWEEIVNGVGGTSDTFLEQQTIILSGERPKLLYIPPLVAHGQMSLTENCHLLNLPTVSHNPSSPDELRMEPNVGGLAWEVQSR